MGGGRNADGLTNTGGDRYGPRFAVLAGCRLLAFQAETGGAEKLTARVEVGAVGTLVSAVIRHAQFGTADLCRRIKHNHNSGLSSSNIFLSARVNPFTRTIILYSSKYDSIPKLIQVVLTA